MARNSIGNYSLPTGNPVQTNTPITINWANGTMSDLGNEITDSLSRSGRGGMLAPLRVIEGTAPLPAYAFTEDHSSGMYLAANSDLRFVTNSSDRLRLTNTAAYIFTPTTVTTTQTNTAGVTSTGNGTGAGVVATGGASGPGGTFTGNGGGHGLTATGQGTGHGVVATGGASGLGVQASGGIGSTTATLDSNGVAMPTKYFFTSAAMPSTTNQNYPLASIGKTTAGNTVGLNSRARSINTVASWTDVELGLSYDVDSTVGAGGQIWLGPRGVRVMGNQTSTSGTPANALVVTNGNVSLDGVAAPTSTVAIKNAVTPTNIVKAWAYIVIPTAKGTGTFTDVISSGFNVASVTIGTSAVTVNFAQTFVADNLASFATLNGSVNGYVYSTTPTSSNVAFSIWTNGSGGLNPSTTAVRLSVMFLGAQ